MSSALDDKPNGVFLNEHDIMELHFYGSQSLEKVKQMMAEEDAILAKLQREGKPLMILGNAELMGKMTAEGRKIAVEYVKSYNFKKIAVYGGSTFIMTVAALVIRALRRKDIRIFKSRKAALQWLLA